jgi:hypothetical protein
MLLARCQGVSVLCDVKAQTRESRFPRVYGPAYEWIFEFLVNLGGAVEYFVFWKGLKNSDLWDGTS